MRNYVRRPRVLMVAFAAAIVGVLVFALGASAILPGTNFEGNDGNLVVNTAGNTDWDNAPNLSVQQDAATGGGDNSFGQGTQEQDLNVTVVSGSIPNSKADLARFAVAGETRANGHAYLYLAWSRENDSGSVHFGYEINQADQPDLTTPGPKTLVRTPGDLNISYDFQGNNLTPALSFRVWSGTAWGDEQSLAGCSEGQGNASTVSDTLGGLAAVPRTTGQFGEAAIDLTCANIVPSNACEPFSSAFVKSRASQSFQSEIKDFIAPVELKFNRCGKLTIIKNTVPPDLNQDFGYTVSSNLGANFTLNDSGVNTKVYPQLQPDTYTVTEDADPVGFALTDITCVGAGGSDAGRTATAVIVAGSDITCTFTNTQQLGAIKVHKTTKAPGQGTVGQAGVTFSIGGTTVVTDGNGDACVDGFAFGSYNVTETVPAGYQADGDTTKSVSVDNNAKCTDNPYVGETVPFSNSPLTDVTISVDSKADGGTASTVTCDDPSLGFTTGANGDGSDTSDVVAGSKTITCTIVIDP